MEALPVIDLAYGDLARGHECRRSPWDAHLPSPDRPHDRTRMPHAKQPFLDAHPSSSSRRQGSAEIAAVVARAAPAVLELLTDRVPRSRAAVVAALAGRHAKEDVVRTLMRSPSPAGPTRVAAGTRWRRSPIPSRANWPVPSRPEPADIALATQTG
jgi:hypothetical protein